MARSHCFRPSVLNLEDRWLPSAGLYPDSYRNGLQASYVAEAEQADNPVVFLGDSITYNWGTTTRTAPGVSAFSSDFAPLDAANFGIYGDTSLELLRRIAGGDLDGQPKVAVVMIGVNDLIYGETPLQAATGVLSVVEAIRGLSPQTSVLLLGVLPTGVSWLNPQIEKLDTLLPKIAAVPGVTYENPGSLLTSPDGAANSGMLLADDVHPDGAAYSLIGDAIEGTVARLLGEASSPSGATAPKPDHTATPTPPPASAVFVFGPLPYLPADESTDGVVGDPSISDDGATSKARSYATELITVSAS